MSSKSANIRAQPRITCMVLSKNRWLIKHFRVSILRVRVAGTFISLHIIFLLEVFRIQWPERRFDVPSLDPICGLELYMAVPSFSCVYLMIGKPPLTLICWRGSWSSTASFSDYTCLTLNMLLIIPWICAWFQVYNALHFETQRLTIPLTRISATK